jgi:hypothetical protein
VTVCFRIYMNFVVSTAEFFTAEASVQNKCYVKVTLLDVLLNKRRMK